MIQRKSFESLSSISEDTLDHVNRVLCVFTHTARHPPKMKRRSEPVYHLAYTLQLPPSLLLLFIAAAANQIDESDSETSTTNGFVYADSGADGFATVTGNLDQLSNNVYCDQFADEAMSTVLSTGIDDVVSAVDGQARSGPTHYYTSSQRCITCTRWRCLIWCCCLKHDMSPPRVLMECYESPLAQRSSTSFTGSLGVGVSQRQLAKLELHMWRSVIRCDGRQDKTIICIFALIKLDSGMVNPRVLD